MQVVLIVVAAVLSPLLGLALLLWLAHLEDTLPQDVQRSPSPTPRRSSRSRCGRRRRPRRCIPAQRTAPAAEVVVAGTA